MHIEGGLDIRTCYVVRFDRFKPYDIEIDTSEVSSDGVSILTTREASSVALAEGMWIVPPVS